MAAKKQLVQTYVPKADYDKLQALATQNERSLAAQLRVVIREFIERHNAERS